MRSTYSSLSVTKKSVIWYTVSTIIQNGILFLTTPLYTRLLTDSQYGVFSVYQSWQQIVSIIAIFALDRCITVGFMKYEDDRKGFLSSVQALMTVTVFSFLVLVCLFSSAIESLMELPLYIIITMFLVALMNNSLANWSWFQRYNYNYQKLAVITICFTTIMQIVSILAVVFLPTAHKGEVLILSSAFARLMLYGILYASVFIKGKVFYHKRYWKFALGYSIAVVPHALAQIVLNSSDRIMIDKLCGRADAAYYGVTYTAAMVLNIIMTSVSSAIQPWVFEKIKQGEFKSIRKSTNLFMILPAVLSVMVSLAAPEALMILAPASYQAALWIFPSVAASVFFNSLYLCFANFESYYEKPMYFSVATITGAAVNVILNYIFIPIFGFVAAGYTTLVCYVLFAVMHYLFMRMVCREKLNGVKIFDMKFLVMLSFVVILLSLGVTVTYEFPIVRYFLMGAGLIGGMVVLVLKREVLLDRLGTGWRQ